MESHYGKCALCRKECELSFEHIPPRAAFNSRPVKTVSGDKIINDPNRMPWDTDGLEYFNQQRGMGVFSLCDSCNSITACYGTAYIRTGFFVFALAVALMPFWGRLIARANVDFQICQLNDVPYAVIMDYGDIFIAQKAKIDDTCMEIDTSKYSFFHKDGVEFEYRHFESISRVAAFTSNELNNAEADLPALMEG